MLALAPVSAHALLACIRSRAVHPEQQSRCRFPLQVAKACSKARLAKLEKAKKKKKKKPEEH